MSGPVILALCIAIPLVAFVVLRELLLWLVAFVWWVIR